MRRFVRRCDIKRFYWRGLDLITGEYFGPRGGKGCDVFYDLDSAKKSIRKHIAKYLFKRDIGDFRFEIFDGFNDGDPVFVLESNNPEFVIFGEEIDADGLSDRARGNLLQLVYMIKEGREK